MHTHWERESIKSIHALSCISIKSVRCHACDGGGGGEQFKKCHSFMNFNQKTWDEQKKINHIQLSKLPFIIIFFSAWNYSLRVGESKVYPNNAIMLRWLNFRSFFLPLQNFFFNNWQINLGNLGGVSSSSLRVYDKISRYYKCLIVSTMSFLFVIITTNWFSVRT